MEYDYTLNGISIEVVNSCKELGVIFESNFEFKLHVGTIAANDYSLLGFIIRSTKEFRRVDPIIAIYSSLISSKFLFGSVIWTPYKQVNIEKLQSV